MLIALLLLAQSESFDPFRQSSEKDCWRGVLNDAFAVFIQSKVKPLTYKLSDSYIIRTVYALAYCPNVFYNKVL
jgi:hypothetical protein